MPLLPVGLAPGTRLGPYEIVALIGVGGMGEVYRAHDVKLRRDVALKVLPDAVANDPARLSRFHREAQVLASLNAPSIGHIYGFEDSDGMHALVLELVEGPTLADRLAVGPLPLNDALAIAAQIAEALESAHGKGIVHRDLKPANVGFTADGYVKVLDFGIAKVLDVASVSDTPTVTYERTRTGVILGTAAYMSPEQATGGTVDRRSDLWSFGVILLEMLIGRRVFDGDDLSAVVTAILTKEPDWAALPQHTPASVRRLLRRCLDKDRKQRLADAADVRLELEEARHAQGPAAFTRSRRFAAWAGAVVLVAAVAVSTFVWRDLPTRQSAGTENPAEQHDGRLRLVVLPFENLGPAEDAYFSAGMTEEIISRLANVQDLAIISRTTAFGYNRQGKSIRQIGADLGVDYVLEGTVRWDRGTGAKSRLRITPELIAVADDTHIWGEPYDRVLADIFSIQSDVADSVVRALGVMLMPRERAALTTASTQNMEAYDFYLRGLRLAGLSHTLADQTAAVRMFQAAVDRDPHFLAALAELAKAHLSIYFYFDRFRAPPEKSHVEAAREVLKNLTALGEDLPETLIARGYYTYWGLDKLDPALADFTRAVQFQPSSIPALSGALFVLRRQGRWQEAGDMVPKLYELDPQNTEILQQGGMTFVVLRQFAAADHYYDLAIKFNRQWGLAWGQRALVHTLWGSPKKAEDLTAEAYKVNGLVDEFSWVDYAAYRAQVLQRNFAGAVAIVDRMKRTAADPQWFFVPVELMRGEAYAYANAPELAQRWLQAARERLETLTARVPKDSRYHSSLALTYAGLGLRNDALREAETGVALMPASTDAWRAMYRRQDRARVHAMLGDQNDAIDELEFLLANGTELSAQQLRLDPRWDRLRSNPRFVTLLAKYPDRP